MTYTQIALLAVLAAGAVDLLILRTRLLARRVFWVSYAIVIVFQLLTNGVLTGFEIVRYNPDVIVGSASPQFIGDGRIAFAPVEDLLFGFALVLTSMAWWVFWGRRGLQREPISGPPRWWLRGGPIGSADAQSGTAASADGTNPGGTGNG